MMGGKGESQTCYLWGDDGKTKVQRSEIMAKKFRVSASEGADKAPEPVEDVKTYDYKQALETVGLGKKTETAEFRVLLDKEQRCDADGIYDTGVINRPCLAYVNRILKKHGKQLTKEGTISDLQ